MSRASHIRGMSAHYAFLLTIARPGTSMARGFPVERKRKARFDCDGSRRILLSNVRNTAERRLRAPRSRLRDGSRLGADHLARNQDAEADPGRGSPRNWQNLLGSGIRGGSKDRPDPAAVLRGNYREAGHRFVRRVAATALP